MNDSYGGDWTEEKLAVLRNYLDAYTSALKNQPFHLMYIDAFAGTGWVELPAEDLKDSRSFIEIEGSARIAARIDNKPFDKLIFIESDQIKSDQLSELQHTDPAKNIIIENKDANEYLKRFCSNWEQDHKNWRGVLFLDPFATQVEWATVEAVARTQSLDTWILFPISAITRMLPTSKMPDEVDPKWTARLNKIFGDESWKELYSPQKDLFGERYFRNSGVSGIIEIYKKKLQEAFGNRLLAHSRIFTNSKNSRMFEFIFCAGHPNGIRLAHRIANSLIEN